MTPPHPESAARFAAAAHPPPDRAGLWEEAHALTAHPAFEEALRAFCRNLTGFHSPQNERRVGFVDTITWSIAVLIMHLDGEPGGANASQLVALCRAGGLSGAASARNAIDALRNCGMIAVEDEARPGLPRRLCPTRKLVEAMHDNLAARLAAIERVSPWPAPAHVWARAPGVLPAFLGGNVAAYQQDKYLLFERFPEVRAFMDRRCGYLVLLDALGRAEAANGAAIASAPPSELAAKYAVSRAHIRKLFGNAAGPGWLAYEHGGRVTFSAECYGRLRLWIGHEFAWTRRLLEPVAAASQALDGWTRQTKRPPEDEALDVFRRSSW